MFLFSCADIELRLFVYNFSGIDELICVNIDTVYYQFIYNMLPLYFFYIVNCVIVSLYHYRVMSTIGQHTVSHADLPYIDSTKGNKCCE